MADADFSCFEGPSISAMHAQVSSDVAHVCEHTHACAKNHVLNTGGGLYFLLPGPELCDLATRRLNFPLGTSVAGLSMEVVGTDKGARVFNYTHNVAYLMVRTGSLTCRINWYRLPVPKLRVTSL